MSSRCQAFAVWVACAVLVVAGPALAQETLYIAGGRHDAPYGRIARWLAERAGTPEVKLEACVTAGSCENIELLRQGCADFALVQYDVAANGCDDGSSAAAVPDSPPATAPSVKIEFLASLFSEKLHWLVRRPLVFQDFETIAIQGRKVYFGKRGTGSYQTARFVVGAAGYPIEQIRADIDSSDDAARLILDPSSNLVAMLRSLSERDEEVKLLIARGLDLQPMPDAVVNSLLEHHPYYSKCKIEGKKYHGEPYDIPTICVATVLVVGEEASADPAAPAVASPRGPDEPGPRCGCAGGTRPVAGPRREVLKREAAERLVEVLASGSSPPDDPIDVQWTGYAEHEEHDRGVEVHELAAAKARWSLVWKCIRIGLLAAAILGVPPLWLAIRRRRERTLGHFDAELERQVGNPAAPLVCLVVVVLLSTLLVWTLESPINANLRSFMDALWAMAMFATGNFDSTRLKDDLARVAGAVATVLSLGLLAWFTAAVTAFLTSDRAHFGRKLIDHVVIVNFRDAMLPLVRMLRAPGPERLPPVHVLATQDLSDRARTVLSRMRGVKVHDLSAESPMDLFSLRLDSARRVLVLSNETGRGAQEIRVIRSINALSARTPETADPGAAPTRLNTEPTQPAPPTPTNATVLAWVTGQQVHDMPRPLTLVETGDDAPAEVYQPFSQWLTPVAYRDLTHKWIAASCTDRRFPVVFDRLLWFDPRGSEVYAVQVPAAFGTRKWREVRRAVAGVPGPHGAVLLGVYRIPIGRGKRATMGRLFLNPRPDFLVVEGDHVIALAMDEKGLRTILTAAAGRLAPVAGAAERPRAPGSTGQPGLPG